MNRKDIIRNLRQENKDLQTQLNITLEDLAEQCWANKEITKLNRALNEKEQQLKQSQKQLAIEKLKQIINYMENSNNNHYPLPYEIKNFIENHIKDLEGIKNE